MNTPELAKSISAVAGVVVIAFGAVNYFQTKTEAAEAKQEVQKTVEQLRAEISLTRVKQLNDKEAKEALTPAEQTERDLLLAQVKAIQAEAVKPKK